MKNLVLGTLTVLLILAGGCRQKQSEVKLTDHPWRLTALNVDKKDVVLPKDTITVEFDTTGRVAGFSGCNRYFGKYSSASDKNLNIEVVGSTMAMCPDIETEDQFIRVLDNSTTFSIEKGVLTVSDENTGNYAAFAGMEDPAAKTSNQ